MIWQTVRYQFDSSKVYAKRAGLFRIVTGSSHRRHERADRAVQLERPVQVLHDADDAPVSPSVNGDTAKSTAPTDLNTMRGLQIYLAAESGGHGAGPHRAEEEPSHHRSLLQEHEDPMSPSRHSYDRRERVVVARARRLRAPARDHGARAADDGTRRRLRDEHQRDERDVVAARPGARLQLRPDGARAVPHVPEGARPAPRAPRRDTRRRRPSAVRASARSAGPSTPRR